MSLYRLWIRFSSWELTTVSFETFSFTCANILLNSFSNSVTFSETFFAFSLRLVSFASTKWAGRLSWRGFGCGLAFEDPGMVVGVVDLLSAPDLASAVFASKSCCLLVPASFSLLASLLLQQMQQSTRVRQRKRRRTPPAILSLTVNGTDLAEIYCVHKGCVRI